MKKHSGVFVRIKDKNLHVECFKCATCGTSLKNQGYYNLNNKLYCDVHARLAAMTSPPPNANGLVPVTYPPWVWIMTRENFFALFYHWKMLKQKLMQKMCRSLASFCLKNIFMFNIYVEHAHEHFQCWLLMVNKRERSKNIFSVFALENLSQFFNSEFSIFTFYN
jgi:hypothetical protein